MGDVALQTAAEPSATTRRRRCYTAMVHGDWEIWGPCGGYVAAIALRAAGAESPLVRPGQLLLPLPLGGGLRAGRPRGHAVALPAAPCWPSASR